MRYKNALFVGLRIEVIANDSHDGHATRLLCSLNIIFSINDLCLNEMKRVLIHCTVDEVDWLVSKRMPIV